MDSTLTKKIIIDNLLKGDTLFHKVEMVTKDSYNFFSTENPVWYILTLIIGGGIALLFSTRQKRNESITEAKKTMLDKRIEKHSELFKIYSESKIVTNPEKHSDKIYYAIFATYDDMNDYYDKLLTFTSENQVFLSKSVMFQINIQNNLRKHIDDMYKGGNMTDHILKTFAIKYYKDLDNLSEALGKAITDFFEKEISLTYKFQRLTDKELEEAQKTLYSYSVISDHFGKTGEIK
jgi:hypothetical protein